MQDHGLPDTPPMPSTPPLHDQTPPLHLLGRGDTETKSPDEDEEKEEEGEKNKAVDDTGVDTEELSTPETSPFKKKEDTHG